MQGRLQEVPETLLKLWFIYERKNSRKVQVEKVGNRGHDVFSYIKSLGANVTGKFLTAIPADITVKDPDTENIPSLSADRPLQKSKFFLSFPPSSCPIPFPSSAEKLQECFLVKRLQGGTWRCSILPGKTGRE